jgi:hypothetical protein
MSTSQQSRIEPGQTWRRGRVEREVIAIETDWPNCRMIVTRASEAGGPGRIVRTFENAFRRWAAGAAMKEMD